MDRRRLADVRAGTADQLKVSGSGYLVGNHLVLTARHVVIDKAGLAWPRVEVWLGHPADGRRHRCLASVHWKDEVQDLALLRLETEPTAGGSPVRWGLFIGSKPVPYEGLAFPRFADYESGRGVEQLGGHLPPLAAGDGSGYVLDQSTAPDPVDRLLWGGASGAAVFCCGLLVGVVAKDDRDFANRRLHAVRIDAALSDQEFARLLSEDTGAWPAIEAVELHSFLRPAVRPPLAHTPGSLLAADIEAVDFTGRERVLEDLTGWRDSQAPAAIALVVGEGGQGKTRLAREFAKRSSASGWIAGFIGATVGRGEFRRTDQADELGRLLRATNRPILLIADYAETHPDYIAAITEELLTCSPHWPVRLLLLSRATGAWWDMLVELMASHNALLIELPPLTDSQPERRAAYAAAVFGLARHLARLSVDPADNQTLENWSFLAEQLANHPPGLSDPRLGNALTLHITALTDLLGRRSGDARRRLGNSVERELVNHEWSYLKLAAARRGLFEQGVLSSRTDPDDRAREAHVALERAIAGLILLGPCDLARAQAVGRLASSERAVDVVAWLVALYSPYGAQPTIGSVQPDRLAELLLGSILTRQAGLLSDIAPLADDLEHAISALLILMRTAAYPQFAVIREQARDLVASRQALFGGAVPILAGMLAHAASLQGLESAVAALEAVSRQAKSASGVRHSEASTAGATVVAARLALVRDAGSPRPKRIPASTSTTTSVSESTSGHVGHLYRELGELRPEFLRDLLATALNILGASDSEAPDQRYDLADHPVASTAVSSAIADREASDAFVALYREHYLSLVRLAVVLVRDVATAEEVVQDSFVALHSAWDRIRDDERALSYLRQSVVNRSRSVLRHRVVIDRNAPKPPPDAPSSEDVVIALLDRSTVISALQRLPGYQREAMVLRYYANLSVSQVAATMGVTESTVKGHLRRGKDTLRKALSSIE